MTHTQTHTLIQVFNDRQDLSLRRTCYVYVVGVRTRFDYMNMSVHACLNIPLQQSSQLEAFPFQPPSLPPCVYECIYKYICVHQRLCAYKHKRIHIHTCIHAPCHSEDSPKKRKQKGEQNRVREKSHYTHTPRRTLTHSYTPNTHARTHTNTQTHTHTHTHTHTNMIRVIENKYTHDKRQPALQAPSLAQNSHPPRPRRHPTPPTDFEPLPAAPAMHTHMHIHTHIDMHTQKLVCTLQRICTWSLAEASISRSRAISALCLELSSSSLRAITSSICIHIHACIHAYIYAHTHTRKHHAPRCALSPALSVMFVCVSVCIYTHVCPAPGCAGTWITSSV